MVHGIGLGILALVLGARAACYYPNGDIARNDVPCQDDTDHATCCGPGYACVSNGICQVTSESKGKPDDTIYLRGSCTDKSWQSSSCPLFCIEKGVDLLNGGNGLTKCQNTVTDTYFCINRLSAEKASCEEGKKIFTFPGTPSILTTIGVPQSTTSSASSSTTSSSSSSTPSPSSSSTTVSSSSSTPTDEAASSSSTTTTTTTTTTTSSSSTSPSQSRNTSGSQSQDSADQINGATTSSSSSSNLGPIIGGALGGTAAVILAGLGGWLLARKQQAKGNNDATGTTSLVESSLFAPQGHYGGEPKSVVYETKPALCELSHETSPHELPVGSGHWPLSGYR